MPKEGREQEIAGLTHLLMTYMKVWEGRKKERREEGRKERKKERKERKKEGKKERRTYRKKERRKKNPSILLCNIHIHCLPDKS